MMKEKDSMWQIKSYWFIRIRYNCTRRKLLIIFIIVLFWAERWETSCYGYVIWKSIKRSEYEELLYFAWHSIRCVALLVLIARTYLRSHEKGWNLQHEQVGDALHRGRIAQLHRISIRNSGINTRKIFFLYFLFYYIGWISLDWPCNFKSYKKVV